MMKVNFLKSYWFFGLFLVALFLAACTPITEVLEEEVEEVVAETVVKIGIMLPLSGDAASYGFGVKRGVELARADLKLENVEVVYEDSKCEGKEAVSAINKLISFDEVVAVVGELCSGATLAAAPVANENKVVMVSPASTSPKVTDAGEFIFRTIPSDALQGDFGANLAYDSGYRKLAILYSNEEYGLGFNNVLKESFGGEVVASEAFERKSVDLRAQLTKIKDAEPDAIYIISNSPDSAVAALKQITELGIEAKLYGSEGLKGQYILDGAGDSAEGLVVTSVSSGTSSFIDKHKEVFGEEPGPFAAQGYDAFTAIAMAIQDGATTGTEIRDKLEQIDFEGASGNIKFDENGDVFGNYDVLEVKEGKFVPVNE